MRAGGAGGELGQYLYLVGGGDAGSGALDDAADAGIVGWSALLRAGRKGAVQRAALVASEKHDAAPGKEGL
ncbi:hypothetical protein GCM10010256_78060 [Streptomyces coeruleorubidus]|nr:hypothetical protein GCM10010256_78060 [Streptomyces coeruleorubidus]